jgi:hypothetical protein
MRTEMIKYIIDIDGTICSVHLDEDGKVDYSKTEPYMDRIRYLNELYDAGHEMHYWTARGSASDVDRSEMTHQQLQEWGVKYTTLKLKKPVYDIWVDDKAINSEVFFSNIE